MKFVRILLIVLFTLNVVAQTSTPARKVIKDQAEYNAYMTALNTQDQSQRGAAMETFVQQYPNSVVSVDALEQAMAAYQQAGNQAKVEDTANRLLQFDPQNVRAFAKVAGPDGRDISWGSGICFVATKRLCRRSERLLEGSSS